MQLIYLAYLVPIFGIIVIGLFVFLRQRNYSVYAFVGAFSLVVVWQSMQLLSTLQDNTLAALWLLRFGSAVASFIPAGIVVFCFYFAYPKAKLHSYWKLLLVVIPTFLASLSLSSQIITSVSLHESKYGPVIHTGSLYTFQSICVSGGFVVGFIILLRALARLSRAQRTSTYFIISAFAVPLIVNFLVGYIFVSSPALQLLGPVSFLIMEALMGYTIIRHGLFNIRAFVIRAVVYTVLVTFLSGSYVVLILNVGTSIFDKLQLSQYVKVLYAGATFLIAITATPLKRLFDRITSKLFYQDFYDSQELLDRFSALIVSTIDQEHLLGGTIDLFKHYLRSAHVEVAVLHTSVRPYLFTQSAKDVNYSELYEYLSSHRPVILFRDEQGESVHSRNALHLLDGLGISAVVRVQTSKELMGYLLLGPKRSGSMYTNQDSAVLRLIADELAVALQNALRFEQIQVFNKTLQQRVEDATFKLRETNKRLRALDEAKDEFISMASHQLRTPLTSVKGYVSMVLDGDGGSLNKEQRKLLSEAFNSAQRMVYLISDFLNVSRIHTGKFMIERKPVQLAEMVKNEVSQLQAQAQNRNLMLQYHQPAHFPVLQLDEDKTRQVIMNFIDNAIYYTPAGGTISIELTSADKDVTLRVRDTGIGVPREERHRLFTKFFRATNARHMRPDGTGIGLFLAKKVIIGQGGVLLFESREGQGSTFGFTLPKNPPKDAVPITE